MEHLRLILILVGLAILGLIWLLHKPEGRRPPPGARRREPKIEARQADEPPERPADSMEPEQTRLPDMGSAVEEVVEKEVLETARRREPVLSNDGPGSVTASRATPSATDLPEQGRAQPVRPSQPAPQPAASAPGIVTLYLRARGQRKISGLSLLDAAIKAGLRFGEMKIFHRRHRGEPRPVFSMANITRPGSFDPSGWNLFETPGVTLFMTLPGPVSALDAWDAMLATGQRLSGILEADLLDDAQCLLTRQRIAQIREDMRVFDRKHGLQ